MDFPIPLDCRIDLELVRRVRLISRFGTLGALFGALAAAAYLLVGHISGAVIVIVCSSCFAASPFLIRNRHTIEPTGHLLILILTLGFTTLCFAEGGFQSHAIAWLVSVPLCALLLLGQKVATRWAVITLFTTAMVVTFNLLGINLTPKYDQKWNPVISAAGYVGLLMFMFIVGLIFEAGRARAFSKMQDALSDLANSNERLKNLNSEKNEYMGIAAHDLRNPLMIILGNAEAAGRIKDRHEVNRLLGNISGAAIQMRDLVADLLDVNSFEDGRVPCRVEPCDVTKLVTQSVRNHQTSAAKKKIEMEVDAPAGMWALANRSATLQILDNLISNALKFSSPWTTVHVRAISETRYILVIVRDEGPGISDEDRKNLFKRYSRLSARPTAGESSTGLGLAIVKRLAEEMSGTVECESDPGNGTAFTLRLPSCADDSERAG